MGWVRDVFIFGYIEFVVIVKCLSGNVEWVFWNLGF